MFTEHDHTNVIEFDFINFQHGRERKMLRQDVLGWLDIYHEQSEIGAKLLELIGAIDKTNWKEEQKRKELQTMQTLDDIKREAKKFDNFEKAFSHFAKLKGISRELADEFFKTYADSSTMYSPKEAFKRLYNEVHNG